MKKFGLFTILAICATLLNANVLFAEGIWENDFYGWRYKYNNNALSGGWYWIRQHNSNVSKCYYFALSGYMLTNCETPDGNYVNEAGEWTVDDKVQRKVMTKEVVEVDNPYTYSKVNSYIGGDGNKKLLRINKERFRSQMADRKLVNIVETTVGQVHYQDAIEIKNGGYLTINMSASEMKFKVAANDNDNANYVIDIEVNGKSRGTLDVPGAGIYDVHQIYDQGDSVKLSVRCSEPGTDRKLVLLDAQLGVFDEDE